MNEHFVPFNKEMRMDIPLFLSPPSLGFIRASVVFSFIRFHISICVSIINLRVVVSRARLPLYLCLSLSVCLSLSISLFLLDLPRLSPVYGWQCR